ncbi:MAG: metallophosphoesterase family protein [Christensenellales bacterium]
MKKLRFFLLFLICVLTCLAPSVAVLAQTAPPSQTVEPSLSISFSYLEAGIPGNITVCKDGTGVPCDVYMEGKYIGTTDYFGNLLSPALTAYSGPYIVTAQYSALTGEATALVRPGKFPLNTCVTVAEDPSTGVNISFMTSVSVNHVQAQVRASLTGSPEEAALFDAAYTDKEVLYKTNDTDYEMVLSRFHSIAVSNLQPDTSYDLYLNDQKYGSFQTAPAGDAAPVAFAVFGDAQQSNFKLYKEHFGRIAREISRNSYDFLINTGDLVNAGWSGREWDWWFLNSGGLVSGAVFIPAMGNHEAVDVTEIPADIYYSLRFKTPKNAPSSLGSGTYSFDYGCVHVAVLDTQGTNRNALIAWLKEDMAQAQNSWRIVILHDSLFSPVRDQPVLRAELAPAFEEAGIHLVLSGHDHIYARSKPLAYDKELYATNNETQGAITGKGPVYVITGRSCDKTYDIRYQMPVMEKVVQGSNPAAGDYYGFENFMSIKADNTSMHIEVHGLDGTLLDKFALSKIYLYSPQTSKPQEITVSLSTPLLQSPSNEPSPASTSPATGQSIVSEKSILPDILLILAAAALITAAVAIYHAIRQKQRLRRKKRRRRS